MGTRVNVGERRVIMQRRASVAHRAGLACSTQVSLAADQTCAGERHALTLTLTLTLTLILTLILTLTLTLTLTLPLSYVTLTPTLNL